MITQHIPSFNAGELSPLIHLRSDLEKYRSGCRTLKNMTITPYGGVERRPGLAYTATAPGKCRLFPFQASISKGFILEFSNNLLRFFKRDSPVQSGGSDYTLATQYGEGELDDLTLRQINNVAYISHPLYPTYKLTRLSDTNWTLEEVVFSHPPMLPENVETDYKITTLTAGDPGDNVGLSTNFSIFTQDHVGAYFQISHPRDPDEFEVKIVASTATNGDWSDILTVQGTASFRTQGTWDGTFVVEVDRGDGFIELARYTSDKDANFTAEFTEPDRCKMRIKWEQIDTGGSSDRAAFLEASDPYVSGLVKITSVASATSAGAEVIKGVSAGATSLWREGAFSKVQGYARTCCAHEQRLVFGGTATRPQTLWASAVDDYENFEPGTDDDQSWSHTLVSGQQNDIQWIESSKALIIGTTGDEWVLSSSKDENIITPTNVRARRHSRNGSDFVAPIAVDNTIIFTQRGGKVVREMAYSFEADGYKTVELTLLAEHITGTGIKQMAWQTHPEQGLWAVTKDGRLLSLTYDREQNVVGWSRHTSGLNEAATFESVAIRQADGEDDQVWVVVKRQINGNTVRYIERLKPDGFFVEEPWNLLYQDTYGMVPHSTYQLATTEDAWTSSFQQFRYGDFVYRRLSGAGVPKYTSGWVADYVGADQMEQYFCVTPHTTVDARYNGSGYPLPRSNLTSALAIAGGQEFVSVQSWQVNGIGFSYGLGRMVYNSATSTVYECILAHTSTANDEPGVGVNEATYWTALATYTTPTQYLVNEPLYETNDDVQHLGLVYTANQNYPARESSEPKSSKWDYNYNSYALNDEVVNGGLPYKCILAHTSATTNEPGVGASWETYWEVIQSQYNEGDIVSSEGINYRALSTHTPDADSEPNVGVNWQTYWEILTEEDSLRFYVDSGVTLINQGILTEVTGLSHLEGQTVQVAANGTVLKSRTVSGGKILLNEAGDPTTAINDISVGLQYDSILEPMALEIGMQNGTSVGREKRIHELVIYFHESWGCKVASSLTGDFDTISFYDGNEDDPAALYSGPKVHKLEQRHPLEATFVIKQDLPMPMQVLCIVPKYNVYGDN